MASKGWRAGLCAALLGALAPAAWPVMAHEGERRSTPATTEATAEQDGGGAHDMSAMSADEQRWPTAEDLRAKAGHSERPTTFAGRLLRWLGAWHPAVIHFPIALLLSVAFLELAAAVRGRPVYSASNKILLALAALSGFAAAPLGWISAGLPEANDAFALTAHRWLGTAIPFLLLALWALKKPADAAARKAPYYKALLAVMVLVILAQAYFGAEVTHGAEHLTF